MKRMTIFSAALLAIALPLAAQDANTWNPGENFLTNWDYDADGTVTVKEVLDRRGDLFDGFDENEDGVLSAQELADHNAMRDAMQDAQERPDWAGQGGQGQRGLYGPGQGRGRQGGWGNGGGRGRMMQQAPQGWGQPQGWGPQPGWGQPQGWAPQGWGRPQGWGQPQGWGPGNGRMGPPQGYGQPQGFGPAGGGQNMEAQMQAQLDADQNGQISRDEFVELGATWLPRFDRNGDGVVTADDFDRGNRW